MGRTEVHRGAILERVATGEQERCAAILPAVMTPNGLTTVLQCMYQDGHEGSHYSRGEIWGNTHQQ